MVTKMYDAVLFDLFGTLVTSRGRSAAGAQSLLMTLPAERWAIVTSCSRAFARTLLAAGALPEPRVLISAEDVAHNKPAPDGYLLAARLLNVAPVRCLVIEDSAHGIAAAHAAGMSVLNANEAPIGSLAFDTDSEGRLRLRR